MAYPKDSGHFALDTRACDTAIGAVPYIYVSHVQDQDDCILSLW